MLFHCGDTFSGDNAVLNGVKWQVGAYGGCEGTKTGRPIFKDTGSVGALVIGATSGDGRISDIDFEGGNAAVTTGGGNSKINYQITLSNLLANGTNTSFSYSQGAQWGIIDSMQASATGIGVFMNFNENNPATWTGNAFNNLDYQALIGNSVNGVGCCGTSAGVETVRFSAGRLAVFENNTLQNSNNVGAVFKLHNGNTNGSVTTWTGVYTELVEISDNLFTGNSGGILSDIAPQNGGVDERLRNFVLERNLYSASTTAWGGALLLVSGANMTVRNNVFDMIGAGAQIYPILGVQVAQRGTGNLLTVQYNEVYNNTFYAPQAEPNQYGVAFDITGSKSAPTINSVAMNNLFYVPSKATGPAVNNTGTGNTVSNNTITVTANPGFTNGSGKFSLIGDFKPTANYSGGVSVPVLADALGTAWTNPPDLGAVHH